MLNWLNTADKLVNNSSVSLESKNYNMLVSLKNQASTLIVYSSPGEQQRFISIINRLNTLLDLNKHHVSNIISGETSQVSNIISGEMSQISALTSYHNTAGNFPYSTPCSKTENSEVLIVLGCKDKIEQSKRIQSLINYIIQDLENMVYKIIFSGGGYDLKKSESSLMKSEFLSKAKQERVSVEKMNLYCESDSMDTVGNALFSRHLLTNIGERAKIKVFTSTFHVKRTHFIFSNIFDPKVLTVVGTNDYEFSNILMESELRSEYLADSTIFTLKCGHDELKLTHNDWKMIMIQLFINHDLYKKRFDLMRKYLD